MKKSCLIFVAGLCALVPPCFAEKGDIAVKFGVALVNPAGDGALDGALDVEDNAQLGLTLTYMLSNNVGLNLLAATPFKHDITVGGETIGETKHLPPTVTVQYHFNPGSNFSPYVGAGLNYTQFFNEKSVLGDLALDSSFGLALEAGFDFKINEKWGGNLAIWNADIDTDAKLDGVALDTVEIDPWVVMAGADYQF